MGGHAVLHIQVKTTNADVKMESKSTIYNVMGKLQQASDWPFFVLKLTV